MDPRPPADFSDDDEWRFTAGGWRCNAKPLVAFAAERQFGCVRWEQMRDLGVSETMIGRWVREGYLLRVLPRVYAVGHRPASYPSRLAAALLYAGPGAALSHVTAVWWWGLVDDPPHTIDASTSRRVKSLPGIRVHGRRALDRVQRKGLAVVTVSQAIFDFAAAARPSRLRFVLANADYHRLLDVRALDDLCGRGKRGSTKLKEALDRHRPELARAQSELERRLLELCETHGLPLPKFNARRYGWIVDAVWDEQHVVVELDGYGAHRTRAQLERDHQRDLELRSAGYIVLRYTWQQVTETPWLVVAELGRYL